MRKWPNGRKRSFTSLGRSGPVSGVFERYRKTLDRSRRGLVEAGLVVEEDVGGAEAPGGLEEGGLERGGVQFAGNEPSGRGVSQHEGGGRGLLGPSQHVLGIARGEGEVLAGALFVLQDVPGFCDGVHGEKDKGAARPLPVTNARF